MSPRKRTLTAKAAATVAAKAEAARKRSKVTAAAKKNKVAEEAVLQKLYPEKTIRTGREEDEDHTAEEEQQHPNNGTTQKQAACSSTTSVVENKMVKHDKETAKVANETESQYDADTIIYRKRSYGAGLPNTKILRERSSRSGILYMEDPCLLHELRYQIIGWRDDDHDDDTYEMDEDYHESLKEAPKVARAIAKRMTKALGRGLGYCSVPVPIDSVSYFYDGGSPSVVVIVPTTPCSTIITKLKQLRDPCDNDSDDDLVMKSIIFDALLDYPCREDVPLMEVMILEERKWTNSGIPEFCYTEEFSSSDDHKLRDRFPPLKEGENKKRILTTTRLMAKELTDHFVFGFHDGVDFFEPFLYGGKASDGNIVAVLKSRFALHTRGSCKWDDDDDDHQGIGGTTSSTTTISSNGTITTSRRCPA